MSPFVVFSLLLLVAVTLFALGNAQVVAVRFLVWQFQTTLALAVIGAAVVGGLAVFASSAMGQRRLRARLREAQDRARELEALLQDRAARPPDQHP